MRLSATALLISLLISPQLFADNTPGSAEQKILLGQLRPKFTLPDRHGAMQSITQWHGRILVLNFWATWCAPCRTEIPLLNALQKEYSARGVQIVGVALDNADAVQQFTQQVVALNYPVLIGGNEAVEVVTRYGNTAGALPYTAFITRGGKIEALASGALTSDYAHRKLEKMLAVTEETSK